ncbi:aflatoxin B1 aldehyde reductase-like protein member 2 [Massarina eburnea CBS 473.64]|uniref:Aflatoxin B1 aldehyde reductase-like protein member 2 n=1 Tax=Massarina eburnea CBS 473.64 TaxID=1395130 RepID=A0A6A6SGX4_9PLEO|nr:aflatoxin B1 aldehyde reductase-like protein member 2 [Massarina eburnea CBS 473.64]
MPTKILFGGASFGTGGAFTTEAQVKEAFDLLQSLNITDIDTARLYANSEALIGAQPSRTSFSISTKLQAGFFGIAVPTKDTITKDSLDSHDLVKIPQFDVLYLHCANTEVPWEEQLGAINEVYKKGIFKRFGISNFTAEQVETVYSIAKEKGYVLPSVFQGNYNPIGRHSEAKLLPTLRKLNIPFYAYSPLAGGFLTKSVADINAGAGRFNDQWAGGLYNKLYNHPALRAALEDWEKIAEKEGVSKAELAYRWVANDSALSGEKGDGVIFGGSSLKQIEQTAKALGKGGLSEEAKKGIEEIWEKVKGEAPIDNYVGNGTTK